MATDPLALESLFVKILVDADPFTAGMQKVTKAVDDLEARLVAFGTKVASIATTSLAPFANSLKGIGSFLNSVTSLKFSNFGPARRGVEEFATFFKDISATFGTAEVAQTAASFQKVGGFLNSMSGFMSKLEAIDLGTFSQRWQSAVEAFTSTAKMVESIDVTKLEPVGKSFKNLSSIVNAAGRFELTKGKTDSIAGFFTGLVDGLNVLTPEAMAKAEQVGKLSNSLARSLRSFFVLPITPAAGANVSAFFEKLVGGLGTVSPEVIDKSRAIGRLSSSLAGSMRYFTTVSATPFTTTSVTSFFTNLLTEVSAVPDGVLEKVTAVNKATRGVAGAVQALGKMSAVNMAAVLTNGKQLVAWLNQLGGVTPAVLNNVSGLGKALSGFARFFTAMGGYGGPLPPIVANIKNVSSAAGGAAGPIRSLTGRFRDFGTSIASASGNLSMMRMSLLGFAGIGVGMFAKFDDSLVRTLAHMERLNNEPMEMTQRPVEESIRKISSASPTSRMDLAKGFDAFARSGMSAGMSMKMLGISESFALAGSMPLRETSVHLADIFRSLGLATGDVNEGYVKMRNLTDLLTGTAFMTGSTAKEMTEAIGPRFTAALKMTNMSLEDTIALVGAYSAVGIRGSQASDRAAQFLISMSKASTENSVRWKQLGVDVYDAAGKMFPLEKIVGQLSGKFAAMSDMQRIATLSLLGFNQRTITAILPILDMGEGLKLLKQKMKEMGGTTEDVANIIRRDFMSQLKILWNSVTEVAIAIGRNLAPILGAVAYWLTGVAEALASLNPAVQSLIVGFIALSAAILVTIKLGSILGVWVALGVVWTGLSVSVMTVVRAFLFLGPLTFGLGMAFVNMGRAAGVAIYGIWAAIKFTFVAVKALQAGIIASFLALRTAMAGLTAAQVALGAALTVVGALVFMLIGPLLIALQALVLPIAAVYYTIIGLVKGAAYAFKGLKLAAGAIVEAFVSAMTSMMINLIPMIVTIVAWVPILIAGATLVVTSFMTVLQALRSVFGTATQFWDRMRERAATTTRSIAEGIVAIGSSAVGMWERIKGGAADVFENFVSGVKIVAGFFWNIRENLLVIMTWLRENWRAAASDIGTFIVSVVETTIKNVGTFFGVVFRIGKMLWGDFWHAAGYYSWAFFAFFKEQWENVMADIGTVVKAFFDAFLHNMTEIAGASAKIALVVGLRLEVGHEDDLRKEIEQREKRIVELIIEGRDKEPIFKTLNRLQLRASADLDRIEKTKASINARFKGPADFLDLKDFKTSFKGLGEDWNFANRRAGETFNIFVERAANIWKNMNLLSPLDQFKTTAAQQKVTPEEVRSVLYQVNPMISKLIPKSVTDWLAPGLGPVKDILSPKSIWATLTGSLNVSRPPDMADKLMEYITNLIQPKKGEPEDFGSMGGKQGPGFTFKQIAENRYMVGGEAALNLDYQQLNTLRSINADTSKIVAAMNKQPNVLPTPSARDSNVSKQKESDWFGLSE